MAMTNYEKERRAKMMEMLRKKKEEEDQKVEQANSIMQEAKSLVISKQFAEAKAKYLQAAAIFAELKWVQQAEMLKDEVANVDTYEQEYLRKEAEEQDRRQKEHDVFEARAASIIKKKEEAQRLKELESKRLSPELQRKTDEAEYVRQKGLKYEEKGKLSQAIARYRLVCELYKELGKSPEEIAPIEEKIHSLEGLVASSRSNASGS